MGRKWQCFSEELNTFGHKLLARKLNIWASLILLLLAVGCTAISSLGMFMAVAWPEEAKFTASHRRCSEAELGLECTPSHSTQSECTPSHSTQLECMPSNSRRFRRCSFIFLFLSSSSSSSSSKLIPLTAILLPMSRHCFPCVWDWLDHSLVSALFLSHYTYN